jgi:carboxymethylenebutenolidase
MGQTIGLKASDGFLLGGYRADPAGKPKGGLVVIQEIFGVNHHIRAVCDRFAAQGYAAVAPAMFDRAKADVELGYNDADADEGMALRASIQLEDSLKDVQAAIDALMPAGKVGIVGYCWGGLLVWRAAALQPGLAAAVSYYGGGMTAGSEPERTPRVPTMSHFGELDKHITLDSVKAFERKHPEGEVHLYQADHGFNCEQRGSYNAGAAATALERTLFHFGKHVG